MKKNLEVLGRLYDARPFNPNLMICHDRGIIHISEAMLHVAVKKDNVKMVEFMVSFDTININQIYWEDNFSSYDISQKNDEEEEENDTFFDGDLDDYCCNFL